MACLGLVFYVRTTFIALAAIVVRCVVLAPSSLWVLGISAARLLVASKFARNDASETAGECCSRRRLVLSRAKPATHVVRASTRGTTTSLVIACVHAC